MNAEHEFGFNKRNMHVLQLLLNARAENSE